MQDANLDAMLLDELASDERVIWTGRPSPAATTRRSRRRLFAAAWTLALFWALVLAIPIVSRQSHEGNRAGSDAASAIWIAGVLGVPLLAATIFVLTEPRRERRRAARTLFAVTTDRAMLLHSRKDGGRVVRSFRPDLLRELDRREAADGSGDLLFSPKGPGRADLSLIHMDGFVGVEDVKSVERAIRDMGSTKAK